MPLYGQASAGSYREYPDRASFDVSYITVSVWVKFRTVTNFAWVAVRGTGAGAGAWGLRLDTSNRIRFDVNIGGSDRSANGSTTIIPGVWYHWVGQTWSTDDDAHVYLNGVDEGSALGGGTMGAGTQAIRLFENTSASDHGDVEVADLNCWNVTLSVPEILALYAGTPARFIQPNNLFLSDLLDDRSIDWAGFVAPADTGNVQRIPRTSLPPYLRAPRIWKPRHAASLPTDHSGAASISASASVTGAAASLAAAAAASITASASATAAATLTEVSNFDAVLWGRQGRRPIMQAYIEGLPDVICTEEPAAGDKKVTGYCLGPFDGTNDYAATGNITDLAPEGDITVVCWFKLGSHAGVVNQTLWSWYDSGASKGWYCYVSDADGKIHLVVKSSDVEGPSVAVDTQYCLVVSQGGTYGCETRFTLFAFTSDGSLAGVTRSYKSGVTGGGAGPVRSSRNADSAAVTAALELGRQNGGSNYFKGGRIGYTAVYTRAFTQSEAERIVYRILDAKWVGYWADLKIQIVMGEGTGTTLKNSSSALGTHNMTINGGVAWETSSTHRPWTITYRPYMTGVSAVGQDLEARATRTTISTLSFQVLDASAATPAWWLTAYLKRVAQAVRRKSCYIFLGWDEILEEEYALIMNGALEAIDPMRQRGYEVRVGDAVRFARTSLLLGKTRLSTSVTSSLLVTTFEIDSLFNFKGRTSASAVTGTQPIAGYVRIDDEIIYYESVQASPVALVNCVRARWGTTEAAHTAGATVTEIFHETATDPITMALMLLISSTGDYMTHATYDAFTRYTADDGSSFDGRGAGMSLADIDVAAIEAVRTAHYSSYVGEFLIMDSIDNLKDWIEQHLLRPIGAFFFTQSDGTLSIGTWHTPSATGVPTLEHGDQSQPEPTVDYSRVINAIELRCDYNPITGTYGKLITHDDVDSGRDHGPSAPLRIDSQWIRTTRLQSGATITPSPSDIAEDLKDLLFARFANPQPIVTTTVGLKWWSKEIAAGLKYQHEEIPDFVQGERGVMGALHQIVSRTLDPKRARVVLKLMRTP